MPDQEHEIRIATPADTSGAERAMAAIEKLTQATTKSGEAAGEAAKAEEQFGSAIEAATKVVDGAVPGAGEYAEILTSFSNPASAAALTIGLVAKNVVELHEELETMENRPGPDWERETGLMEKIRGVYRTAAREAADFNRELAHIKHEGSTPQQRTDSAIGSVSPSTQKAAADARAAEVRNAEKLKANQANLEKALAERDKLNEEIATAAGDENAARLGVFDLSVANDVLRGLRRLGLKIEAPEDMRKNKEEQARINDALIARLQRAVSNGEERSETLHNKAADADLALADDRERVKGATAMSHGGKVDANQTQLLNMLVSLLNNVQTNQAQTIRAVAEANKNAEAQQTLIEDVKKSIANLALRIGQTDNTNHH
jgi:hypothetical protein